MKYLNFFFAFILLLGCTHPRNIGPAAQVKEKDFLQIVYATQKDGSPIVGDTYNMTYYASMPFPNAQIIPFEENYALLDFKWIVFNFLPYYRELMKEKGIKYSPQFDCEDYANTFKLELQTLYGNQPMAHQGLAVATIIYYTEENNRSHAINAIFGISNGNFACILVEPQNGSLLRMDTFDMSKVWLVLL
jgi:hypothetical protein